MIEITDGVAREYEWVDGEWVLVADSPWNEDLPTRERPTG
jgi:hypothetical protein